MLSSDDRHRAEVADDTDPCVVLVNKLSERLEKAAAEGRLDMIPDQVVQALFRQACSLYEAKVQAGCSLQALEHRESVSATAVMLSASALLQSAHLELFELGMWQAWSGRH